MRLLCILFLLICSCEKEQLKFIEVPVSEKPKPRSVIKVKKLIKAPVLVLSARKQIGITVSYDPAYRKLAYPGGDVPQSTGVCTDVVIRALRESHKMDLQKLVHEDMKKAFNKYPKIWGLSRLDKNIDHRRVPNLQCFFKRNGDALDLSLNKNNFLPGDIVTCLVGNRPHIMIVSNRTIAGIPLVIHNIGSGTKEDNSLFSFKLSGQYRIR